MTDADDVRLVAGPGRSGTPVRAPRGQSPTPFIRYADHTPLDFLLQALTLNLGSVCAGAMVGLFSPVLWAMHRASRRCERARTRRIHRMATSFSAVIDAVLRRSHKYTYTQVATKGKSWFLSAHDTVCVCLSVCLSACLSVCLPAYLFVCLSVCLRVCVCV